MRILVTGPDGQVGWELRRTLAPLGEVIAVGRDALDMADPQAAAQLVREIRPQIIVNAAAYTAVDKAESEEPLARTINALTPGAMAVEAQKIGALLIHYSTDYVFNGRATQAYTETDSVDPVSAYGRSKEEGERLIRDSGTRYLILRTAWVYGTRGKNFLLTMLRLARERDRLRVVGDQIGSPTWSRLIAETTAAIIARSASDDLRQTLNLTCQGQTSWQGFASAIIEGAARRGLSPAVPVDAITTADYPTAAHRPAYSVLSGQVLAEFGFKLPGWEQALELCLDDLRS